MNIQKQIDAGNRILDEHNRLILNSGDVDQLRKAKDRNCLEIQRLRRGTCSVVAWIQSLVRGLRSHQPWGQKSSKGKRKAQKQ